MRKCAETLETFLNFFLIFDNTNFENFLNWEAILGGLKDDE
jgi:hypothetical protein